MSDLLVELTVILTIIWWFQKLDRLSVSKQAAQKFYMERFSIKKLNDVEVKEEYQDKISNRFATLENLDNDLDINRVWQRIRI
jgi:hypothetical protein